MHRYLPRGPAFLTAVVKRALVAVVAAALTAGCQLPGRPPGCAAAIDWVDFVQVGGTHYVAAPASDTSDADLGPVYAKVKFRVSDNVCDPGYRIKDGDAAFLEAGTPLRLVNGHPAAEELAARRDGRLVIYQATHPPET